MTSYVRNLLETLDSNLSLEEVLQVITQDPNVDALAGGWIIRVRFGISIPESVHMFKEARGNTFMKKDYLVLKDLNELRRVGRLSTEEIAYKVGDSIIAYHPVTKEERFIKSDDLLLESFRTILKD